jgi:hypothetical protein
MVVSVESFLEQERRARVKGAATPGPPNALRGPHSKAFRHAIWLPESTDLNGVSDQLRTAVKLRECRHAKLLVKHLRTFHKESW